jgi:hypothetical protein
MRHAGGAQRFQVLSQGSRGLHAVVLDHGDEFSTEKRIACCGGDSARIVREGSFDPDRT